MCVCVLPAGRGSGDCYRRASSAPAGGVPTPSGWWRAGRSRSLPGTVAARHSALPGCSPPTTCPPPFRRGPCSTGRLKVLDKGAQRCEREIADLPEQELRWAVPSRGHILGVVGIGSLREVAGKAWWETGRMREAQEPMVWRGAVSQALHAEMTE